MTNRRAPLLVVAAGGTGGHMFPAQALSQEMLRRGWRVALSSDGRGLRYAGGFSPEVERRETRSATFSRGGIGAKLKAPFEILAGARGAMRAFRSDKPACVVGFGGYPTAPALIAAWRMNLPRMVHEQNGVLGRVNRLFAARVHALAAGVEPLVNAPRGAKVCFVGNPIRDAVCAVMGQPYDPPEPGGPIRLLIFGGSQGASIFANVAPRALATLSEDARLRLSVVQQARDSEVEGVRATYDAAGIFAEVAPFFADMPKRLAEAHLVICRAGASTIAELAAIGRPSILVPFAAAMGDHQTANARTLSKRDAAVLAPENAFSADALLKLFDQLFADSRNLEMMAEAARAAARPQAASALADLVEDLAGRRVRVEPTLG